MAEVVIIILKPYCGRFMLDIYRFSRTFAITVQVILLSGQVTARIHVVAFVALIFLSRWLAISDKPSDYFFNE